MLTLAAIVSMCASFLVFSAVADTRGLYLCTSDMELDDIEMLAFFKPISDKFPKGFPDKSLVGREGKYIEVYKRDSWRHKHFRHCFVLLGEETNEAVGSSKNVIWLKIDQARGYSGGDIIQDEMWWLGNATERNKYVTSCTPVLQEGVYSYRKFPWFKKSTYNISRRDVAQAWVKTSYAMDSDASTNKSYSTFSRNCCTVAHNGLRNATAIMKERGINLDLSQIGRNARSYNFLGRGVEFDTTSILNEVVGFVQGTSRSLFDIPSGLIKIGIRKFNAKASNNRTYENKEL
ncbi:MAG: hypothetical protein LBB44_03370 [Endomicrobium sp.]|jgi:hypothetical protein|nr:hypothetical protein [Endomicrobium sp.]